MPTTRFCQVIGAPERTWRRWQARSRTGAPVKGPWPRPARDQVREAARRHALAHPAWGHRKVWAMCRHDGLAVSATSVLRLLRGEGLLLEANYQRERRQLAARRKAAFAVEPTAPNQVWQLDFTEFETTTGGTSVGIALGELAERSAGEAFGLGEGKFDRGDGVVLVRRRRDVPT